MNRYHIYSEGKVYEADGVSAEDAMSDLNKERGIEKDRMERMILLAENIEWFPEDFPNPRAA